MAKRTAKPKRKRAAEATTPVLPPELPRRWFDPALDRLRRVRLDRLVLEFSVVGTAMAAFWVSVEAALLVLFLVVLPATVRVGLTWRHDWKWTHRNVGAASIFIVTSTVIVTAILAGSARHGWWFGLWSRPRLVAAVGLFVLLVLLSWWRSSGPYLIWSGLVFAVGLMSAAGRPTYAVLSAAAAFLLVVALTFGRVVLRFAALATLAVLLGLAVATPPPEEQARLRAQQSAEQAVDAAADRRSQAVIAAQTAIQAGEDPGANAKAAEAAGDEEVAAAQRHLDQVAAPSDLTGVDDVPRAVSAWITHGWHRLTGSESAPSPTLDPWQWALLIFLAVFVYRYLEVLSSKRSPGPVTITAVRDEEPTPPAPDATPATPAEADGRLGLAVRFRLWLDETELRNSAAVPGGTETQRILKLLQTESSGNGIVDNLLKVVRLVTGLAFPETGFTVSLASQPSGDGCRVTARLSDTRTGRVLAQCVREAEDEDRAGRNVAYQVAWRIAELTNTLPRWSRWETSDAWMEYDDAWDVEGYLRAIQQSPGTGLARAGCANANLVSATREEMGRAYAEALSVLLPVTLFQTRFTPARYRVVVMLAYFSTRDGWRDWNAYRSEPANGDRCERVARMLYQSHKSYGIRYREAIGRAEDLPDDPVGAEAFRRAAARELRGLSYYSHPTVVAWWAFVPSERRYWLELLRSPRRLRHDRGALQIAKRVLEVPMRPSTPVSNNALMLYATHHRLQSKVETITSKPHCGRQALYNAACFHSRMSESVLITAPDDEHKQAEATAGAQLHIQRAFVFLYRAIYEPEGGVWSSEWVRDDPDLKALHADQVNQTQWHQLLDELGVEA